MTAKRVLFYSNLLMHYRVAFHEAVRERLAADGVEYRLVHGLPDEDEKRRGDGGLLDWAESIASPKRRIGPHEFLWLPPGRGYRADLIILGQENRHFHNYLFQMLPLAKRVALFGHGRNFQARRPDGLAERWKRHWSLRCDWWFGYTEETRRHIEALGFPPDRITIFNNAVDTRALRRTASSLGEADIAGVKTALGIESDNVAVFVGGLHRDKRLEFLVEATERVRLRVPDFQLVVVGGGVDRDALDSLSENRPWLILAGPRFGREKAAIMRVARLFLMPGLVGLAVLDAYAAGLPIVTTAFPYHSPEIAYLEDGVSGLIVPDWDDADAYAEAVAALMLDEPRRARLASAAAAMAEVYTIEGMAERFTAGVRQCLGRPPRA